MLSIHTLRPNPKDDSKRTTVVSKTWVQGFETDHRVFSASEGFIFLICKMTQLGEIIVKVPSDSKGLFSLRVFASSGIRTKY